jgi:hypothetical protein
MTTTTNAAKNRIQIINWRRHGDDENYVLMAVFAADQEGNAIELAQDQVDPDYDWTQAEGAEEREDYAHVIYVNDDFEIVDGEVIRNNGRAFRITIEEVL